MEKRDKSKNKTDSEKIAKLVSQQFDQSSEDDSDHPDAAPRVVDFDDEYHIPAPQSTEIRKRNVKLLSDQSSRYQGKIVTRKDLYLEEDEHADSSNSESGIDDQQQQATDSDDEDSVGSEEETSDDSENSETTVSDAEDERINSNDKDNDIKNLIEPRIDSSAELKQGISVQNQLRTWEKLLELRIQMQKVLSKSNALPNLQCLQQQEDNSKELANASSKTASEVSALLQKLMELQQTLRLQFPEIKKLEKSNTKRKFIGYDDEGEPALKRVADQLESDFNDMREYRNAVLLKWDDRTKLLKSGTGMKSSQEEFDIIGKINNALSNRKILIEKCQTPKPTTTEAATGSSSLAEGSDKHVNRHIYDDSDFYHHLLRELIESKTNTSANALEVTKQYAELQKLRQKMKKQVDTRASKGRKLRYVVYKKLINFMAPEDTSAWTEESRSELFKSLFA